MHGRIADSRHARTHCRRVQGAGEDVALRLIAPHLRERIQLWFGFDALGEHVHAE
jgi:hypothetical protein